MISAIAQFLANVSIGLMSPFASHHTPPTECASHDKIEYCYYKGDSATHKVIYFNHGFGNDQKGWTVNPVEARIEDYWTAHNIPHPTVVTISKQIWWYTEKAQGDELTQFVKWFESTHISFEPDRIVYGDSMGGHNSYRWALDYPDLFSRMALICPALPRYWAPNSPGWVQGAYEPFANMLISEYYNSSSDPKFNPINAIPSGGLANAVKRVHVIAATNDQFGFHDSDVALFEALKKNPAVNATFEEQAINHCDADSAQLAEILGGN